MNPLINYYNGYFDENGDDIDMSMYSGPGKPHWSYNHAACFASLSYNYDKTMTNVPGDYGEFAIAASTEDYESLCKLGSTKEESNLLKIAPYWARQVSNMGFPLKFMHSFPNEFDKSTYDKTFYVFRYLHKDYINYIHVFTMLNIARMPFEYPNIYILYRKIKQQIKNVDPLAIWQMALMISGEFYDYGQGHLPIKAAGYSSISTYETIIDNIKNKKWSSCTSLFNEARGNIGYNDVKKSDVFVKAKNMDNKELSQNKDHAGTEVVQKLIEYVK